jgi:hypothetical protein
MRFKQLLSWIFKRDFTVTPAPTQAELDAARAQYDALPDEEKAKIAVSWTGDCSPYEVWYMTTFFPNTAIKHMCCDAAGSSLSCSQKRYACVGHYGVCCSRC